MFFGRLGSQASTEKTFWTDYEQLLREVFSCLQGFDLKKNILKPKAISAGITENPAAQIFLFIFFIDNSNSNITLYTLSCPKSHL